MTDEIEQDRRRLQHALRTVRHRVHAISRLLEVLVDEVTRLQGELDDLNTTVDTYETGVADAKNALEKVNADLAAQLAAGPPGLTAAQGDAFAATIAGIKAKLVTVQTTVAAQK